MKSLKVFILGCMFWFMNAEIYSQPSDHSIYGGIAIPVSKFASNNLSDPVSGWALTGFGIGFEKIKPVNQEGLGALFAVEIYYNGIRRSVKDQITDEVKRETGNPDPDITWPKYFNIPISLGFNYIQALNESISVFGNAGLTINLFKVTDHSIENDYISYNPSLGVGGRAGLGLMLFDYYTFHVKYMSLGKHDLNKDGSKDYIISMITVCLGIIF